MTRARSNGEGSIYWEPARQCWRAAVSLPDGRRKTHRAKLKREAREWLDNALRAAAAGMLPAGRSPRLAAYLDEVALLGDNGGGHRLLDDQVDSPLGTGDRGIGALGMGQEEDGQIQPLLLNQLSPVRIATDGELVGETIQHRRVRVGYGRHLQALYRGKQGHVAARVQVRKA